MSSSSLMTAVQMVSLQMFPNRDCILHLIYSQSAGQPRWTHENCTWMSYTHHEAESATKGVNLVTQRGGKSGKWALLTFSRQSLWGQRWLAGTPAGQAGVQLEPCGESTLGSHWPQDLELPKWKCTPQGGFRLESAFSLVAQTTGRNGATGEGI